MTQESNIKLGVKQDNCEKFFILFESKQEQWKGLESLDELITSVTDFLNEHKDLLIGNTDKVKARLFEMIYSKRDVYGKRILDRAEEAIKRVDLFWFEILSSAAMGENEQFILNVFKGGEIYLLSAWLRQTVLVLDKIQSMQHRRVLKEMRATLFKLGQKLTTKDVSILISSGLSYETFVYCLKEDIFNKDDLSKTYFSAGKVVNLTDEVLLILYDFFLDKNTVKLENILSIFDFLVHEKIFPHDLAFYLSNLKIIHVDQGMALRICCSFEKLYEGLKGDLSFGVIGDKLLLFCLKTASKSGDKNLINYFLELYFAQQEFLVPINENIGMSEPVDETADDGSDEALSWSIEESEDESSDFSIDWNESEDDADSSADESADENNNVLVNKWLFEWQMIIMTCANSPDPVSLLSRLKNCILECLEMRKIENQDMLQVLALLNKKIDELLPKQSLYQICVAAVMRENGFFKFEHKKIPHYNLSLLPTDCFQEGQFQSDLSALPDKLFEYADNDNEQASYDTNENNSVKPQSVFYSN